MGWDGIGWDGLGWDAFCHPAKNAVQKSSAVILMLNRSDAKDLHAAVKKAQENPALRVPPRVQFLSPMKLVLCLVLIRIQVFLKCLEVESAAAAAERIKGECLHVSDTYL